MNILKIVFSLVFLFSFYGYTSAQVDKIKLSPNYKKEVSSLKKSEAEANLNEALKGPKHTKAEAIVEHKRNIRLNIDGRNSPQEAKVLTQAEKKEENR